MQLEEYFDFLAEDDVRLKGTRVGIESILLEYLDHGRRAEEIAAELDEYRDRFVYVPIR
jgi:hypothetical protein